MAMNVGQFLYRWRNGKRYCFTDEYWEYPGQIVWETSFKNMNFKDIEINNKKRNEWNFGRCIKRKDGLENLTLTEYIEGKNSDSILDKFVQMDGWTSVTRWKKVS